MQQYQRGDIVRKPGPGALPIFAHVEHPYQNGKIDVVLDRGGKVERWDGNSPEVTRGTAEDMLVARNVVEVTPDDPTSATPRRSDGAG